jgi:hypothetical protein
MPEWKVPGCQSTKRTLGLSIASGMMMTMMMALDVKSSFCRPAILFSSRLLENTLFGLSSRSSIES